MPRDQQDPNLLAVALGKKGNVKRHLRLSLRFCCFRLGSRRLGRHRRLLRAHAHPLPMLALKDVCKDASIQHLAIARTMAIAIGSRSNRHIAQHTRRQHLLFRCRRLVVQRNQVGNLLIPRGEDAGLRNIHEQRSQHQLQPILVALIQRRRPLVLHRLQLPHRRGIGHGSRNRYCRIGAGAHRRHRGLRRCSANQTGETKKQS